MNMTSELKAVCESYGWIYEAAAADFKTFVEYAGIEDEGAAFTEWLDETLNQNGEEAFCPEPEPETSIFMAEVDLEGSGFNLYYDLEKKALHLLDLDEPFDRTLTNNASNDFFKKLLIVLVQAGKIPEPEWPENIFLYHTDGMVSAWVDGWFKYADPEKVDLFGPFMEVMEERKV